MWSVPKSALPPGGELGAMPTNAVGPYRAKSGPTAATSTSTTTSTRPMRVRHSRIAPRKRAPAGARMATDSGSGVTALAIVTGASAAGA